MGKHAPTPEQVELQRARLWEAIQLTMFGVLLSWVIFSLLYLVDLQFWGHQDVLAEMQLAVNQFGASLLRPPVLYLTYFAAASEALGLAFLAYAFFEGWRRGRQ